MRILNINTFTISVILFFYLGTKFHVKKLQNIRPYSPGSSHRRTGRHYCSRTHWYQEQPRSSLWRQAQRPSSTFPALQRTPLYRLNRVSQHTHDAPYCSLSHPASSLWAHPLTAHSGFDQERRQSRVGTKHSYTLNLYKVSLPKIASNKLTIYLKVNLRREPG